MATAPQDVPFLSMGELVRRRDTLVQRLNDGDAHIRNAAAGVDTSAWEDLWISLLHDYEAVCREIKSRDGDLSVAA